MEVKLYDSETIDQYEWPKTEDGLRARDYLYPLIKEGVEPFLHNVKSRFLLLTCSALFLPITINEREYDNSYVASNFYAIRFYEENISSKYPRLYKLQKPFLFLGEYFLKFFKINQCIFINNWLMTNSLAPPISQEEMSLILNFLKKHFPKHTLIFRHIDPLQKRELKSVLEREKFHLLKTRDIFFYTPSEKALSKNVKRTLGKDLDLIAASEYEIVRNEEIQECDLARILELYELLYVQKYTPYSPRYTLKYLKNLYDKKIINFVGMKKEGRIDAVFGYFVYNQGMMNCLFGYDTHLPNRHDIYIMLTRLVLNESEKTGLTINDGSGGEQAKRQRGLKPYPEYMGLYNKHLPLSRRLLWETVAHFYKIFT